MFHCSCLGCSQYNRDSTSWQRPHVLIMLGIVDNCKCHLLRTNICQNPNKPDRIIYQINACYASSALLCHVICSSIANLLCFQGDRFGGALDAAARQFSTAHDEGKTPMEFVNEMRKKGQLIMGIGHRVKSVSFFQEVADRIYIYNFIMSVCKQKSVCPPVTQNPSFFWQI